MSSGDQRGCYVSASPVTRAGNSGRRSALAAHIPVSAVNFSCTRRQRTFLNIWGIGCRFLRGLSEDTDGIYQETSQIARSGQECFFSLSFFWKDIFIVLLPLSLSQNNRIGQMPNNTAYLYIQEEEEELKIKKRKAKKIKYSD